MNSTEIVKQLSLIFGDGATPGQAFDAIMNMRREGVTLDEARSAMGNERITLPAKTDLSKLPIDPKRDNSERCYTNSTLMPWGKWRGKPLNSVPDDYWVWLLKQPEPIRDKRLVVWLEGRGCKQFLPEPSLPESPDEPPMEGDDVPF